MGGSKLRPQLDNRVPVSYMCMSTTKIVAGTGPGGVLYQPTVLPLTIVVSYSKVQGSGQPWLYLRAKKHTRVPPAESKHAHSTNAGEGEKGKRPTRKMQCKKVQPGQRAKNPGWVEFLYITLTVFSKQNEPG